jgi:hypothetical protein
MSSERLRAPERIPEAEGVEAAWSDDLFDFTFPVWSETKKRAASGIVRNGLGRRIFGVIFTVPYDLIDRTCGRKGRRTLDAIEGEGANYKRTTITVKGIASGQGYEAITYLPIEHSWKAPTDLEYANHILAGLDEWHAPQDYVEYVRTAIARALKAP